MTEQKLKSADITSEGDIQSEAASTLLNECGKWHPDAIERALAQKDRDSVRAAYARGPFWNERVEMAQWWSDYLDRLKDERKILRPAFG